ncbi:hypothetical protein SALBM311S_04244 [Streptomyces alboniger]
MSDMTDTTPGWLSSDELEMARARMPILYVEAVPVRVDDSGEVTSIGLLLRIGPDGTVSRTLVSGRVMHHERVRDALLRHLEKDLGPVALPRVPTSLQPFTVAEYFPTHGVTPYHDPRQHAVSLAYVVPVAGDCRPGRTPWTWSGSARRRPCPRRCRARCRAATESCSSRRWRMWAAWSELRGLTTQAPFRGRHSEAPAHWTSC